MIRTVQIDLDVAKVTNRVDEIAILQQGESEPISIEAAILMDGEPFDLTGASAVFICLRPDKTWFEDGAVTVGDGVLTYSVDAAVAKASGSIKLAYFAIKDADGHTHTTDNFVLKVNAGLTADDVTETDDYKTITELLAELQEQKEGFAAAEKLRSDAEDARAAAEAERSAAEKARESAEKKRSDAESGRVKEEAKRVSAESARVEAEKARASSFSQNMISWNSSYNAAEDARDGSYASAETERDAKFEADMAKWAERVQTLSEFFYIDEDGDLCQHD